MPPLLADIIHARACIPICEKFLTLPKKPMCYRLFYDQFQFIGGMKVGEPSADGRGSAPPELAEQQARAGSEAAPATPPL